MTVAGLFPFLLFYLCKLREDVKNSSFRENVRKHHLLPNFRYIEEKVFLKLFSRLFNGLCDAVTNNYFVADVYGQGVAHKIRDFYASLTSFSLLALLITLFLLSEYFYLCTVSVNLCLSFLSKISTFVRVFIVFVFHLSLS